jgi:GntR family transcriptional regulator
MAEKTEIGLDPRSGVPVYRQIIDQIVAGLAAGSLRPGDQLPTVRQLAVDLAINPNTVIRAYRELEIRGVLDTQQGSGTFISDKPVPRDDSERQRRLTQVVGEFVSRLGREGFSVDEAFARITDLYAAGSKAKGEQHDVSPTLGRKTEKG